VALKTRVSWRERRYKEGKCSMFGSRTLAEKAGNGP
jgi:hypothetical protein